MIANLWRKWEAIKKNGFVHSVSILVGGSVFAQGIAVLTLPLLTHLYTPEDFNALAVYTAGLGIISVIACLRLEIAIPLPEREDDAANLLALALCFSALFGLGAVLVIWAGADWIVELTKQRALRPYLWLFPLGIWLASSCTAIQYWSIRKKEFGAVAKVKISQAIGGSSVQIGMGWIGIAPLGLLLGQCIKSGAGFWGLGKKAWKTDQVVFRSVNRRKMYQLFRRYERFPKYSTLESFANSAGIQLPLIIIAAAKIGPEAGYLLLATQVMAAPMALVGGAIAQVFLSQAPAEYRAGQLGKFTSQTIDGLIKMGVGPLIFAGILAPKVFPLIFGNEWQRAGELVAWMTPWFVVQFIASPISMILHVTENQKIAFVLQMFGCLLRVGSVLMAASMSHFISEVYAISSFVFYVIYIILIAEKAELKPQMLMKSLRIGMRIFFWWATGALLVLWVLGLIIPR